MTKSAPRFRSVRRLVSWMQANWHSLAAEGGRPVRLPREIEQVFFQTRMDTPNDVAQCLANYSMWAGRLEPEFEALLKPNRDAVVDYIRNVCSQGGEVDLSILSFIAEDSRNLYMASKFLGRLPEDLEASIKEPRYAFLYAKEVLRGRLPADMECVFFGDPYHAAKYAFDVIRGFSPCRLPEALHNMMLMASFEDPDNSSIKTYLQASESDPSKFGNSKERVT